LPARSPGEFTLLVDVVLFVCVIYRISPCIS